VRKNVDKVPGLNSISKTERRAKKQEEKTLVAFCVIIQIAVIEKTGGYFVVLLKESLYRLLGRTAGGFFNSLNLLLKGNLPPFGSVCVIIKKGERYLLLEQSHGKVVLPGGFIRWREDPLDAAMRECKEETGLQVRILDMIGCFSCPSDGPWRMSTLTLIYSGEISGGRLRRAIEGHPMWCLEAEVGQRLELRARRFFEAYLRYYRQPREVDQNVKVETPISERL